MYPVLSDNLTDIELAIAGMTWVDGLTKDVLMTRLVGKQQVKSRLLNFYERRRQLAYCLGIINLEEYEDAQTISEIRNVFAHELPIPNFEDERISKLCDKLSTSGRGDNRQVFIKAAYHLATVLSSALYDY